MTVSERKLCRSLMGTCQIHWAGVILNKDNTVIQLRIRYDELQNVSLIKRL